ncbi:MAG: mannitol dehydrogenase family protein [Polaromonas sp.]|jgi:fructuronate reductase|nr:mannitol dehydrogenase family protein [Polaromonas sp.]
MSECLNSSTLQSLRGPANQPLGRPGYPRAANLPGVVHLGLGAFHRAHQAMVFDALMQRGDGRWGLLGVAMKSTRLADAMAAQDGLYSVQINSREGCSWVVVGSVLQTCVAARERHQVVAALASPATRWVTLTVTEKGYGPELAALLVDGFAARRAAQAGALTVASCDNLNDNGRKLQQLCTDHARSRDAALAGWMDAHCFFPNSMVDRIVPAATPERLQEAADALGVSDQCALGTEGYWEWVIENRFAEPADADVLASVGVKVVTDVHPFEQAKLYMLNGSHSAMACMGAVLGLPTVSDCVAQPQIRSFVHALMTQDIMPGLARPDTAAYRDALLARFANPALKHSVHQIATDNSLKIPQRWPPSVAAQLASGGKVKHLAFAAAAWMRYCRGVDEHAQAYSLKDPNGEMLQATARRHAGDAPATVKALLGIATIWGEELPRDERWTAPVTHWLQRIKAVGLGPALVELNLD